MITKTGETWRQRTFISSAASSKLMPILDGIDLQRLQDGSEKFELLNIKIPMPILTIGRINEMDGVGLSRRVQ